MKILVFSDSHSNCEAMRQAVAQHNPDCVFHLGDHYRDAQLLQKELGSIRLYAVPGNCDYGTGAAESMQVTLDGVRFFLTHGHRYSVKFSLLRVIFAAQETEADVLCFGHTHQQMYRRYGNLHVLNPGACGGIRPKYALVTVEQGAVQCDLYEMGGNGHDSGN